MGTGLIIIGGGELARVIVDAVKLIPDKWNVLGFVDEEPCEEMVRRHGVPRLGCDNDLEQLLKTKPEVKIVLGFGGHAIGGREIVERFAVPDEKWASIIHPSAVISHDAHIAHGVVVLSRVVIQTGALIEKFAIINNGAVIEHDVIIGQFTHIAPGVVTGGACRIGENCHVGLGARVRDHINIWANVTVGVGAVVVTNIPENETVAGIPARRLSQLYDVDNINVDDICVRGETPLYEAISTLGTMFGAMIIFVTDEKKKVLGVLTHGDIRDALLDHSDLNHPVRKFMNTRFHYVTEDVNRIVALEQMKALGINRMPVLDSDNRVVGVHLKESMIGRISIDNTVVIMAGGKGTRLRPITHEIPKPMVTVAGRPILEHLIRHLVGSGLLNIYISVNYLSDVIENYFKNGKEFGCKISYLREDKALGTTGSLGGLTAVDESSNKPILVLNGDLITNFNVQKMFYDHLNNNNLVTIGAYNYNVNIAYGVINIKDSKVISLEEKPRKHFLINSGIYVIQPESLKHIPRDEFYDMTSFVEDMLKLNKQVGVHLIEGDWADIAGEKDLANARRGTSNSGTC